MAKKAAKKSVKKPVKKVEKPAEKSVTKPIEKVEEPKIEKPIEKVNEKVPFKSTVEVKVKDGKILDFEEGVHNASMLLKCFGDGKLQLGENTDGNVIVCKKEVHAVLEFSEIWHLMSICKL